MTKESEERRSSPRIAAIPTDKRPFYGVQKRSPEAVHNVQESKKKRGSTLSDDDNSFVENDSDEHAIARVKETVKAFERYWLRFKQEEEKRCKEAKEAKDRGDKGRMVCRGRADLKAVAEMKENGEILYPEKRISSLAGIDVGHQFSCRAEMVALGFHGHWPRGIDFMNKPYGEDKSSTLPLAVAVVISGQYEDNIDNLEEVEYTGEGGNALLGKKCRVQNQVLSGGNLALKNNAKHAAPVRVIRGHKNPKGGPKFYTYDGLYKVVDFDNKIGASGFSVYKFKLKRLEGQPKLATNQVVFVREQVSNVSSKLSRFVSKDICEGQEDIHIPVINAYDDPPVAPAGFKYLKSIQLSETVDSPPDAPGCNCNGDCTDPEFCACAKLNGSVFPYDDGRLEEPRDVVYECGPRCGCGPSCINRASQGGLKYQLEVCRTENKGWAVISKEFIPAGAPVCEYTGILRRSDDLEDVSNNDYIFDIDCLHTMKGIGERESRSSGKSIAASNYVEKITECSEPEFCIDAGSSGNISRFINHSCDPNLFVQCVLSSHHDLRLARVVLFAGDDIPSNQELVYDYGYTLDSVIGPDGKIKTFPCYCGAAGCRKRLY